MQHPHSEWIKLRTKNRENELQHNARTKEIAVYMIHIMPAATISQTITADIGLRKPKAKSRRVRQTDVASDSVSAADTHIRPSKEIIYETPKREWFREDNDDDYDDDFLKEDAKRFGRENLGPLTGP